MANEKSQRELIVPPGSYVYVQDTTKGIIKVYAGPIVVNPTAQEVPVVFDPRSGFQRTESLEEAMRASPIAREGQYIVLLNPADSKRLHPMKGSQQILDFDLAIGQKVVIPGPADFPLWPQQAAEVIEGHHLKSNQYLTVRIYNEKEAQKNWVSGAVMRPAVATTGSEPPPEGTPEKPPETGTSVAQKAEKELTTGTLHIIKGTEVSFYIPPTGVEVVKDESGRYVRDALTLERMEYTILVDENGNKRYEKGPQVVFPMPTEKFQVKDGAQKQSAIELNDLQGLHLKAIADCEFNGVKLTAGQEYFLTGAALYNKDDEKVGPGVTIYYPREEIAFVKYDGKTKIFAVTVPEGEGRYVLNRITGEITTEQGPKQLLPNPCKYVIVRRVLTSRQCSLFYPGNQEALAYNQMIAGAAATAPTTRAGAISEGDLERFGTKTTRGGKLPGAEPMMRTLSATNYAGESSRVSGDQRSMGDEFERSSGYTAPRTLTLNTKYQGAVAINVWTGYAVQVVSKSGSRRLVTGPSAILLDYDEELEAMELSTGKPKNTDSLLHTAYLRVEHNKVSDIIRVETSDHVELDVKLSYKINFTGDPSMWFKVENYVKFFCDHARSLLKGEVRKITVEEFYRNSTDIIRDILLGVPKTEGGKRPGLFFEENGMRMDDLEVLTVVIVDQAIQKLLADSQLLVVRTNVELSTAARNLEVTNKKAEFEREAAETKNSTVRLLRQLEIDAAESDLSVALAKLNNELKQLEERGKVIDEKNRLAKVEADATLALRHSEWAFEEEARDADKERELATLRAETEEALKRFEAAKSGLSETLVALSNREVMMKVSQALNIQQIIGGESLADAVAKVFAGTPLADYVNSVMAKPVGTPNK